MKRIVFLTCIGSLALALTAWGAPRVKERTDQREVAVRAARMSSPLEAAAILHRREQREMSLLRDLISMRSRRHRGPDPVHSLVQECRGVVAWRRLERATRALQMPERQPLLATAPRLIAREVLLGQTHSGSTAMRRQGYAARGVTRE